MALSSQTQPYPSGHPYSIPPTYASQPMQLDENIKLHTRVAALENELWHARTDAHAAREANRFLLESFSRQPSSTVTQSSAQPLEVASLRMELEAVEHDRHTMRTEIDQLTAKLQSVGAQGHWHPATAVNPTHKPDAPSTAATANRPLSPDAAYPEGEPQHVHPSTARPNIYQGLVSENMSAPVPDLFAKPTTGRDDYAQSMQQHLVRSTPRAAFHRQPQQQLPNPQQDSRAPPRRPDPTQHWKAYAQQEPVRLALAERHRYQDWDAEVYRRDTQRTNDLDYGDHETKIEKAPIMNTVATPKLNTKNDEAKRATPTRETVHSDSKTLDVLEGRVGSMTTTADMPNKINWQPLMPSPSVTSEASTAKAPATIPEPATTAGSLDPNDQTSNKVAVGSKDLTSSKHASVTKRLPDPFGRSLRSYADLEDDDAASEASTTIAQAPSLSHEKPEKLAKPKIGLGPSATNAVQARNHVDTEAEDSSKPAIAGGSFTSPHTDDRSGMSGRTLRSDADLEDSDVEANTDRVSSNQRSNHNSDEYVSDDGSETSEDLNGSDKGLDDDRYAGGSDFSGQLNYDGDHDNTAKMTPQAP